MNIKKLNSNEKTSIAVIANKLDIPYLWLYNLLKFESGFNPKIKNPFSSASGLLQFINSTSRSLGFDNSIDLINKLPDFISQMNGAVYPYLKQFYPFRNKQSLYMSVFYPKYRNVDPYTEFPEYVKKVNPGIVTVSDYINKVEDKKKK